MNGFVGKVANFFHSRIRDENDKWKSLPDNQIVASAVLQIAGSAHNPPTPGDLFVLTNGRKSVPKYFAKVVDLREKDSFELTAKGINGAARSPSDRLLPRHFSMILELLPTCVNKFPRGEFLRLGRSGTGSQTQNSHGWVMLAGVRPRWLLSTGQRTNIAGDDCSDGGDQRPQESSKKRTAPACVQNTTPGGSEAEYLEVTPRAKENLLRCVRISDQWFSRDPRMGTWRNVSVDEFAHWLDNAPESMLNMPDQ